MNSTKAEIGAILLKHNASLLIPFKSAKHLHVTGNDIIAEDGRLIVFKGICFFQILLDDPFFVEMGDRQLC